jgi:hypothetical protein
MGRTSAYCTDAALAIVVKVSPVESETRCRWKKLGKPLVMRFVIPTGETVENHPSY